MAHFNQASVFWQNGEYEKALQAYKKAKPYMEGDPLLKELMGYALILTGMRESGEKLLREIQHKVPDFAIVKNSMAEDYMEGRVDAEGIATLFKKVDEDRQSILDKKRELEKVLSRFPRFRSGILSLSITWLQLHRAGEALETLNQFLAIEKGDPEVHYYMSVLYAQRRDYPQAWNHLKQTEAILKTHHHFPKILKELRRELLKCCPE